MTSYELIELYDEILLDINKLKPYSDDITKLSILIDTNNNLLVDCILNKGLYDDNTITFSANKRDEIIKLSTDFVNGFDMLKNHSSLIDIKQKIDTKRLMPAYNKLEKEINNILLLLDIYSETTQNIYNYIKNKNNLLLMKMLYSIRKASYKYNEIINDYSKLKEFVTMLERINKEEIPESEEEIYLHFYNEENAFNSYIEHFSSLLRIYNEFKNVFKSNIELKVIKIESGSFLDKLLGDKNIISLITDILHKCFDLVYRKYTTEGKLIRKTDILKFIKEELDIIERCKSLGIENSSDTKEAIDKTLVIISGEILKLAGKSTKIRVNDEILRIEDGMSEKYLLEHKTMLIEDQQSK
ncbi:MAG: hypothetical protein LBI28_15015 [Treponema sp.]|jgi:hypothetical protein|nr:hypothetical protein [Treponema sp.]